jgi:hypothetical protein
MAPGKREGRQLPFLPDALTLCGRYYPLRCSTELNTSLQLVGIRYRAFFCGSIIGHSSSSALPWKESATARRRKLMGVRGPCARSGSRLTRSVRRPDVRSSFSFAPEGALSAPGQSLSALPSEADGTSLSELRREPLRGAGLMPLGMPAPESTRFLVHAASTFAHERGKTQLAFSLVLSKFPSAC